MNMPLIQNGPGHVTNHRIVVVIFEALSLVSEPGLVAFGKVFVVGLHLGCGFLGGF